MINLNLSPGLHLDVDDAHYHADQICEQLTLSRGTLVKLVDDCPLQAWAEHARLGNVASVKVTKKMDFGSMAHAMILGVGGEIEVFEADNWMTKAAKEFRDGCRAAGRIPALTHEYERARNVAQGFDDELMRFGIGSIWGAGKSEVVCIWDESADTRCRCKFDRLMIDEESKMAWIFDLKVGEVTHPKQLDRHIYNQKYHVQREFYTRGLVKVRPDLAGRVKWTNIFMQDDYPFKAVPAQMNGEFEVLAKSFVDRGLERWAHCRQTDSWPSYTNEVCIIAPPPWAIRDELGESFS